MNFQIRILIKLIDSFKKIEKEKLVLKKSKKIERKKTWAKQWIKRTTFTNGCLLLRAYYVWGLKTSGASPSWPKSQLRDHRLHNMVISADFFAREDGLAGISQADKTLRIPFSNFLFKITYIVRDFILQCLHSIGNQKF